MARTRAQIQVLSELHHGRSDKDSLMDSLCDTALKVALMHHPFKDSRSTPSDFTITEDATSVSISSITGLIRVITARIVEADGAKNDILKLKNPNWWDNNIINPEDNMKGWPVYGMRYGTDIILDRPAQSGIELRLRVSTEQTFASDDTVCPIALLDVFVEQYVTAYVFQSIEQMGSFIFWKTEALGKDYDRGIVGGSLLNAINADKFEPAEDIIVSRDLVQDDGLSVLNQITGHDRYGETDVWYR